MNEKPALGAIVPILGIGGIIAACCVGPVLLGSGIAGIFGWLAGLSSVAAVAVALFLGAATYGFATRRKLRREGTK